MSAGLAYTTSDLHTVASNIGFTEGPVWTDDGRLFVTSVSRGLLYEVFLDGRPAEPAVETGGGPNGMTLAPDGTLWITQNGGEVMPTRSELPAAPSLQAWHPGADRKPRMVSTTTDLTSPSDCTFDSNCLWFTDPNGHGFGDDALPGRVFRYDTTTHQLDVMLDDVYFPNGIAFGADPSHLYVAETARNRVSRFRFGDGHLINDTPADGFAVETPDGLAVDEAGGLWVAGSKSGLLTHFDVDGRVTDELDVGKGTMPTSVCFAGPTLDTLVVTAAKGGRVLALSIDTAGLSTPRSARAALLSPEAETTDSNGGDQR